jgi:hypothetical protein
MVKGDDGKDSGVEDVEEEKPIPDAKNILPHRIKKSKQ